VVLVATEEVQQRLLRVEIPPLQQWLQTKKGIVTGDRLPHPDFRGLLITSPSAWLTAQLLGKEDFPPGIPTLIDGVDDLEDWTRTQLTVSIHPGDWDELMLACPDGAEAIREARVQLTKATFRHPANPYECYLISQPEQEVLSTLFERLGFTRAEEQRGRGAEGHFSREDAIQNPKSKIQNSPAPHSLPDAWQKFWQRWQMNHQLRWATISRSNGSFSLYCAPAQLGSDLAQIWSKQPVVLIGSALDQETEATIYRQRMGLPELTCLKFAGDRHSELIQLYLPDQFPLPNTPQFQVALMQQLHSLMSIKATLPGLTVVLVGDTPLKSQVGVTLAAEFGSRVQVEKTCLDENGILVSGWEFWRQHQDVLPDPRLIVIPTLPLPSLENPLVAGRVDYYKRSRLDWFRLYLLPTALNELARAIAPVRNRQGVVALLDSRVLHRSYGQQVLAALSPLARSNYLDSSLFSHSGD
jgi:ATP-dependent DNA helicase DinG